MSETHSGSKRELGLAAVEQDRPREERVGGEAAREGVEERGLARPGGAHEGRERTRLGVAGQALQHPLGLAAVPECHRHREVLPCQPGRDVADELRVHRQLAALPPQRLAERAQPGNGGPAPRRWLPRLYLLHHLVRRAPPRHGYPALLDRISSRNRGFPQTCYKEDLKEDDVKGVDEMANA